MSSLTTAARPDPLPTRRMPVVTIVGRPNVGKSTLFNRLVRTRRAIVDDMPGVTRDRITARATHRGHVFTCVDTGGFSAEPPRNTPALTTHVRAQMLAAIDMADCVICVFDGRTGLVPEDRDTVDLLRRCGRPVVFAVNKLDTGSHEHWRHEFHAAGIPDVLAISAAHARGLDTLLDAVVTTFPTPDETTGEMAAGEGALRLALIGRPNVGKSSLLNRLLGEERAIVAAEAGTTRDPVDTPLTVAGRPYILIDTAGIRRRGRVHEPLERHGAVRALGMLERSDLVLFVLDATEGMTDQDARLVGRAWAAGRGVLLLANKWDLVSAGQRAGKHFRERVASGTPAFAELPLLCVSAHTGEGLGDLFPMVTRVARAYDASLPTPKLNRVLRAAVAAHPPPNSSPGRAPRLLYATQTGKRPPTVTVFAGGPAPELPPSYARYLTNRIAHTFGVVGVPLRLLVRPARQGGNAPRGRRTAARRISPPTGGGKRSPRR